MTTNPSPHSRLLGLRGCLRTGLLTWFAALSTAVYAVGPTIYTTPSTFAAAVGAGTVYTLPLRAPVSGANESVTSPWTSGATTYTSGTNLDLWNDGGYGVGNYYLGTQTNNLDISLSNSPTAVNFYLGLYLGAGSVSISVNGGATQTFSVSGAPSYSFFGINSPVAITSIAIVNLSGTGEIDLASPSGGSIPLVPPSVAGTPTSASITSTTATLGGDVTSDNGATITERGVVYALTTTNNDPLISGTGVTKATTSGTTGVFTVNVSSLSASSGYSFKAYATNGAGTTYSNVATFSTPAAITTPGAPTSLVATVGNTQLSIAFSTPVSDGGAAITNYEYSSDNGSTWTARSPAATTSPVVITGLTNGTTYQVKLRAVNSQGSGTASSAVSGTPATTPGAPTSLVATAGNTQLSIAFSTPGSDGGNAISNYEYSSDNGSTWTAVSPASTASPVVISGLTNGTTYQVKLRAVNAQGSGTASSAVSGTPVTTPGAPTSLVATVGNTQLSVAFTAPVSDGGSALTNYEYSSDNGSTWTARSPAATTSPVVITGLSNGTTYQVKLRAVNSVGTGTASSAVSGTPATTSGAPTSLVATVGNTQLSIAFSAPGSDGGAAISNYEYSSDNGSTWTARSPAATSSPVVITGLTNGTTYQVKLRAVNSQGSGTASSAVSGTPATTPGAPTALVATVGSTQLSIAFTAPGSDGGAAISNYEYSSDNGSTWTARSPAATTSPVVITGLTNGTTYQVKLRAANAQGSGTASSAVNGTPATTPSAPTSLVATAGNTQLSVAFSAPGSDGGNAISNYEYSSDNGSTWTARSPAATTSPVVITGLANGTTYQVKLRAVNAQGSGTASSAASGTPATTPDAPTALVATSGNTQLSIAFTAPAANGGAAVSNYEYSTDNGSTWTTRSPAATTSPVVITGLANGTTYQVKLRAVNVQGSGTASSAVSGTPATTPDAPTALVATAGNAQASVAFNAPASSGGAAISNYEYSVDNGSTWTARSPASTTSPVLITSLSNGTVYQIKLRAVNAQGSGTASTAVSAAPLAPPTITGTVAFAGTYGSPISAFTVTTGGGAPATFAATGLPVGLSLNPTTGVITGSPSRAGTFTFTVSATNVGGTGSGTLTFTVGTRPLRIAGLKLATRAYDGTTTAQFDLSGVSLSDVVAGDSVSLSTAGAIARYADANVGTGKYASVSGLGLAGAAAANYSLEQPTGIVGTITPANVTLALVGLQQTYDGSAKAVTARANNSAITARVTYDGAEAPPVNAGSYAVRAVSTDANYAGTADGTLVIAKAAQTITITAAANVTSGTSTPVSARASSGLPVTLSVASGNATLTNGTLSVANVGAVVVRGTQSGNENYQPASADVTVTGTRSDRLVNLSARVRISGPATVVIAGFVIGGNAPKQVLIRGVGPALRALGVADALVNPTLKVYKGAELIAENDDWNAADGAVFERIGAFALPAGSKDAALAMNLQPGAYTVHVGGSGGTGVALAEIYDASVNPNGEYQRLVNISSLGEVTTGEGVLVGGFVIAGSSSKRVLIRGIGPTLAVFGATGALADPKLRVFRDGFLVAENDNWSAVPADASLVAAAAGQTGAFALPSGSKDAAMIATLTPGAYTAQVSAADGTSIGAALVEVYEIPD